MSVRVRIAPSPTGFLHVGNVRAALFNWLYARHHGGSFIVRIDDTDVERSEKQYEDDVKAGFAWLGLDWDEGVDVGGPHGSYRQSDRFDHYREVAQRLVEDGHAYYDDRPPEVLEALRQRAQAEKKHPNAYIRRPPVEASAGVIRFSVPQDAAVEFHDLIRDAMRFEAETVDDFVILRSDGTPTYHLASTVDDVDYEITHVVRGEDLLSSTPKHILLTRSLGAATPTYAHLPLLFGPDGKKLSKRHGDTSLRAYREGGYLPEAMVNFLCLLGWSLDAERTIFSAEEAIAAFELDRVSKNPAVFDIDKLQWMNGEYVRAMSEEAFLTAARDRLDVDGGLTEDQWARFVSIAPLVQERTKLLTEIPEQSAFLFADPEYDESSWSKVMEKDGVPEILEDALGRLSGLDDFGHQSIEEALRAMLEAQGVGARKGLQPLRVALTGSSVSPPLFESMAAVGQEVTLERIREALARLAGEAD